MWVSKPQFRPCGAPTTPPIVTKKTKQGVAATEPASSCVASAQAPSQARPLSSAERSVGTEAGGGRRGTRHWNRISVVEATQCNGGAGSDEGATFWYSSWCTSFSVCIRTQKRTLPRYLPWLAVAKWFACQRSARAVGGEISIGVRGGAQTACWRNFDRGACLCTKFESRRHHFF